MKITKGSDRSPIADGRGAPMSKRDIQLRLARQAAKEKGLAKYIPISCGHSTDIETQQQYGYWRPKRGMVYCETCGKWKAIAKPPKPKPISQEPMF